MAPLNFKVPAAPVKPIFDHTERYKIFRSTVERFSETTAMLVIQATDKSGNTLELNFMIESPLQQEQASGRRALKDFLSHTDPEGLLQDSDELVGRAVSRYCWAGALRAMEPRPPATKTTTAVQPLVAEPEPAESGKYVYVISCTDSAEPTCKIGIASSPERRLKQLSTSSPHALRLDYTRFVGDASAIERAAHKYFGKHRKNGEWFSLSARTTIAFVNQLADAA